jgi:hypothetical protein
MVVDHWFDRLSRELISPVSRRNILGATAALATRLLPGGALAAKQKKPKKDACDKNFTTNEDRDFCRTKRGRCKRAGTDFCIVEGDFSDPAKIATCCHRGDECCKANDGTSECCEPPTTCCPGVGCIAPRLTCCPEDDLLGACFPGDTCCPGLGCKNTKENPRHCGRCGNACASGKSCINGRCIRTEGCPLFADPCGGSDPAEPDDCCDRRNCFYCETGQCISRCAVDPSLICIPGGDVNGNGKCCWPTGHGCAPGNPGQVATCCSARCVEGPPHTFRCA